DTIEWAPGGDPRITPNNNMYGAFDAVTKKAKFDSTIVVNGRTFYVYTAPVDYSFSQLGTYRFPVIVHGTFASDCPGEADEKILVVVGQDLNYLNFIPKCGSDTVTLVSD